MDLNLKIDFKIPKGHRTIFIDESKILITGI
jgi:hypothetical protein